MMGKDMVCSSFFFESKEDAMTSPRLRKIAVVDNSVEPDIYRPVDHWARYLPPGWVSFRAPDGKLPNFDHGFTHLILTGSEASVLDLEPWANAEIDWIREADHRGLALLGSCYGHQLLAAALAGPDFVGSCSQPELGWIPVEACGTSEVFGSRGTISHVFSLHFDEVRSLPAPFVVLAETDLCPVQAFAHPGKPVRGYQIHPEIDPEEGRFLLRAQAERNGRGGGDIYRQALQQTPRDSGLIHPIVREFLSLFSHSS
jgi:GMP synthase-like glutamine amidotransferase